MMRCLYRLRRRVALIICPELALPDILRSPSVPDRPGYDGTTKPMERALRDRLAAERQLLERPGFFDVEDARQLARERKSGGVVQGEVATAKDVVCGTVQKDPCDTITAPICALGLEA